jgi:hypothetical protein
MKSPIVVGVLIGAVVGLAGVGLQVLLIVFGLY